MEVPHSPTLHMRLPRPTRGGSSRVTCGSGEVVLEAVRGGFSLLWLDGQEARRYALGLPSDAELHLELRAPRYPLRIAVRETVTLLPRARLTGYVGVPLVPTLVWTDSQGRGGTVLELTSRELAGEWDEHNGLMLRCTSSLHVRFPMRTLDPRAIVPVRLYNDGDTTASPGFVPIDIANADLRERRGSIVTAPRRVRWSGNTWQVAASVAVTEAVT